MNEEELTESFANDSGGGWNYRMVEVDGFLHLREIYYDSNGNIRMWTQEPAAPVGDDVEDLAGTIALMERALLAPVLRLVNNKFVEVEE